VIDPSGRVIKYGYNGNGNPTNSFTSLTDASGAVTTFNYSGGDLISITDPLGNTTQITYLNGDKVGTITDATGKGTITFTYNSGNTVVTDRNGNNTTYTYNQQLQVTKVTDPLGHNESTTYDANYDVSQYMDSLGDQTNFVFNTGTNTLHSAADGNKATTTFTYPTPGSQNQYYPLSQTDPQNNTTNYAYDSNGNLLSATNKTTNTGLTYTYNSNGTINTQTDADGNVTTFGYDSEGNLTSVTPPSTLGKTTLVVDPQTSRVKSVTDGNGNKTSYSYDALDRITKITYNSGATISYNFDGNGNLTSETDNTGTTSFTYDVLNRIIKKSLPDGVVFTTGYDKNGNLTSFNDGGGAVTYQYDAANRMTILTDTDGSQTIYSYDNANRKTMIQYPNGTGMRMTYDAAGHELTAIGGTMDSQGNIETTYSSFTYTYNAGSSPTQLVQTVTFLDPVNWSSGTYYTRDYSYDSQNRLVDADVYYKGGTQEIQGWEYGYDAAGNRTTFSQVSPTITASYTYQAGNELTSAAVNGQTTSYSYDGNGNLTGVTPGGPSFNYNGKNQTTSIGSNNYTYSGPAQTDRVQINSTTLDYSGLGLSRQEDSSGTTHFVRCSCGMLNNERLPSGTRFYYLFDGLGSIVGMTSGVDGSKTNSYDYDPFGVMLNETQGKPNPWQYAGGYLDASGYYQFSTRYYDPSLGRWTQQDPVGGSLADLNAANRYTYAGDDPINVVDPSGEDATACILGLAGSIVGAIASIAGVAASALGIALATGAALVGAIFGLVGALLGLAGAAIALVATIVLACGVSPQQVVEVVGQLVLNLH